MVTEDEEVRETLEKTKETLEEAGLEERAAAVEEQIKAAEKGERIGFSEAEERRDTDDRDTDRRTREKEPEKLRELRDLSPSARAELGEKIGGFVEIDEGRVAEIGPEGGITVREATREEERKIEAAATADPGQITRAEERLTRAGKPVSAAGVEEKDAREELRRGTLEQQLPRDQLTEASRRFREFLSQTPQQRQEITEEQEIFLGTGRAITQTEPEPSDELVQTQIQTTPGLQTREVPVGEQRDIIEREREASIDLAIGETRQEAGEQLGIGFDRREEIPVVVTEEDQQVGIEIPEGFDPLEEFELETQPRQPTQQRIPEEQRERVGTRGLLIEPVLRGGAEIFTAQPGIEAGPEAQEALEQELAETAEIPEQRLRTGADIFRTQIIEPLVERTEPVTAEIGGEITELGQAATVETPTGPVTPTFGGILETGPGGLQETQEAIEEGEEIRRDALTGVGEALNVPGIALDLVEASEATRFFAEPAITGDLKEIERRAEIAEEVGEETLETLTQQRPGMVLGAGAVAAASPAIFSAAGRLGAPGRAAVRAVNLPEEVIVGGGRIGIGAARRVRAEAPERASGVLRTGREALLGRTETITIGETVPARLELQPSTRFETSVPEERVETIDVEPRPQPSEAEEQVQATLPIEGEITGEVRDIDEISELRPSREVGEEGLRPETRAEFLERTGTEPTEQVVDVQQFPLEDIELESGRTIETDVSDLRRMDEELENIRFQARRFQRQIDVPLEQTRFAIGEDIGGEIVQDIGTAERELARVEVERPGIFGRLFGEEAEVGDIELLVPEEEAPATLDVLDIETVRRFEQVGAQTPFSSRVTRRETAAEQAFRESGLGSVGELEDILQPFGGERDIQFRRLDPDLRPRRELETETEVEADQRLRVAAETDVQQQIQQQQQQQQKQQQQLKQQLKQQLDLRTEIATETATRLETRLDQRLEQKTEQRRETRRRIETGLEITPPEISRREIITPELERPRPDEEAVFEIDTEKLAKRWERNLPTGEEVLFGRGGIEDLDLGLGDL